MRSNASLGHTALALFSASVWLACCGGGEAEQQILRVDDVGLDTPESVLHDPLDDIYLVSNIGGEGGANGIAIDDEAVWVASWAEPRVFRVDGGGISHVRQTPAARLDGLALRADDGTSLVSSWDGEAIYSAAPDGEFAELFGGLESAAGIGLDAQRNRLLVPLFGQDALVVMRLP